MQAVVTVLAFLLTGPGPVVEPKLPAPKAGRILPEKITAKPGKLLILDAGKALGEVLWDFDESMFDAEASEVAGKKLTLAVPQRRENDLVFTVTLFSKEPFVKERVVVTLPGSDGPTPLDGQTGLEKQLAALAKLVKDGFAAQDKANAQFRADIAALQVVPTPPDPKPNPPPVPTSAKLYILAFYDKTLKDTPAIVNDLDYWELLKAGGHGWRKVDIKNKDADAWKPYFTKNASPPCLVINNHDNTVWLGTVPMPKTKAEFDSVVLKYTLGVK